MVGEREVGFEETGWAVWERGQERGGEVNMRPCASH